MKEQTKYLRLKEITSELNRKMDLLQSGSLSKADLEQITDESRELYERLVVLRYKAYNDEVKGGQTPELIASPSPSVETTDRPSFAFKIEEEKEETKPEMPIQVSLIDAIEEVSKADAIKEEPTSIQTEEVSAPVQETVALVAAAPVNPLSQYLNSLENKESVNEKLSKSIGNTATLAEKLEHHPIADLKRAISLNQRFQFSKELFKGNNQDYEVAIEKLNSASRDEAMRHLDSLRNKYAWSSESPVTNDFVGLVERRHL